MRERSSRTWVWVVMAVGTVLAVAAPVLFVLAIWTVGPDSMRFAGTGVVLLFVGSLLGWFASYVLTEDDR